MTDQQPAAAVELHDVSRHFHRRQWGRKPVTTVALDGVSLLIPLGSRFGIVGESGSGKTTIMRLATALDQPTSGVISVLGQQVNGRPEPELGFLRRSVQAVFQDPMSSLDPRRRIAQIVAEPLIAQGHRPQDPRVGDRVAEVLAEVGLDTDIVDRFPHQFSGGQRQRISIARALIARPSVLFADEAVSALDVTVRAQILDLLAEVTAGRGMTLIFISHDLAVVRAICDAVAVLQAGRLVESGAVEQVYTEPQQDYTRALLAAAPRLDRSLHMARTRAAARQQPTAAEPDTDRRQ